MDGQAPVIEHAIFTSAKTEHAAGYHIVAASAGLSKQDHALLATMAPAHDALAQGSEDTGGVSCWSLPGDRYCLADSTQSGIEYSGRGMRLYTNLFLIPREVWNNFAANPLAVRRALRAKRLLRVRDEIPAFLSPISLPGRTPPINENAVEWLTNSLGKANIQRLVDEFTAGHGLAIVNHNDSVPLIEGLINSLPLPLRDQFTFSIGMRYASCRKTRVICVPKVDATIRNLVREGNYTFFEPTLQARANPSLA
jgi:hypothetical protein